MKPNSVRMTALIRDWVERPCEMRLMRPGRERDAHMSYPALFRGFNKYLPAWPKILSAYESLTPEQRQSWAPSIELGVPAWAMKDPKPNPAVDSAELRRVAKLLVCAAEQLDADDFELEDGDE